MYGVTLYTLSLMINQQSSFVRCCWTSSGLISLLFTAPSVVVRGSAGGGAAFMNFQNNTDARRMATAPMAQLESIMSPAWLSFLTNSGPADVM